MSDHFLIILDEEVRFMEYKLVKFYIWLWILCQISLSIPRTSARSVYDPRSLDEFIHNYAEKAVKRPRTGILYKVSLPSNYSGVEVSFVRLKAGSFWIRGRNSSLFRIPPRVLSFPYVKRLDIVFQNLGNLSSFYYNIPNYTFVAPVIGFHIYGSDANNSSSNRSKMLALNLLGDPVMVQFPRISVSESDNAKMRCVRFGANGTEVEFSDVIEPNYTCFAHHQGHFTIVVPSLLPPSWVKKRKRKVKVWLWWIVGGGGFVLLVFASVFAFKIFKAKKIERMEKQSEKSEALDTVWVGRSKMPLATGIRSQPILEHDDYP